MAVKAVEDILDMKYNQIHKQVAHHATSRKTSASSSSFSSHMADVHKRTSWQENIKGYTASESIHDEGSQFDSGVFSEEGQNFLLNKRSNDPQTPVEISSTSV